MEPTINDRTPATNNAGSSNHADMVMALVDLRSSVQGLNQDIAALSHTVESATRSMRTLDRKIGAITLPLQTALFEYSASCQNKIAKE
jgi:hypothetical protein